MAVVQVNPPGMLSTDEGYVSSITVRTGGGASVLTPDASTGQITVSSAAATWLVQRWAGFKLITG